MNEMRKLMETLTYIEEEEYDQEDFKDDLQGTSNRDVIAAYDDEGGTRNLDIRGTPVDLDKWRQTMNTALRADRGQYNDFNADKVADSLRFAIDEFELGPLKFRPGREGSVVLYVHGEPADLKELASVINENPADFASVEEVDLRGGTLRLWWD